MAQLLGQVTVGTVVKLNENGSPVDYLVVHQGRPSSFYDTSCDGTWLLRQDIAENRVWDSGNSNVLESSDIHSYLNNTWINRYDSDIRNAIKQVRIPYRQNGGSGGTDRTGSNGLQCRIFLLSGREVGWDSADNQYFPNDGAKLDYFIDGTTSSANSRRVANLNGSATHWWLRSPNTRNTSLVWYVYSSGNCDFWYANGSYGVRPALILPSSLLVSDDGSITTNMAPTLTVPEMVMQGQSATVSWSEVEGADSYTLERKSSADADWTQVYSGANLSYTETVGTWTSLQYRVCAVFGETSGGWATSGNIRIVAASALVISGSDGDLGTLTSDVSYSVSSDQTAPVIDVTVAVNGGEYASFQATSGQNYSIGVLDLPTGTGSIVITATTEVSDSPVTVTRTWTYIKAAQRFPASGGVAQLTQDGQNVFPLTLAEAVKAIGGPWGGNLSTALDKLALAAVYNRTSTPKYTQVTVDLSTAQAGDTVNLPENGVMVPFYVASLDYEPTLNTGGTRVLLVRKDVYQNGQWNASNVNTYANSTIDTWFNSTYLPMLESWVQTAIGTTKFYYTPGDGDNEVTTLERAVFALSAVELGKSLDFINFEGSNLLVSLEKANIGQWSRSPFTDSTGAAFALTSGGGNSRLTVATANKAGYRPCFTLPATFTATYYVDPNSGTVYPSQEYTTAGDFADLWGNIIPTVKIETGSYTGTGTYGSVDPNTLTFGFKPQILLISQDSTTNYTKPGIFVRNCTFYNSVVVSSDWSGYSNVVWDANTVKWFNSTSTNGPYAQFNASGVTYYYVAIG